MLHQGRPEGSSDRLGGEVVGRGAQATGGDQHTATPSRGLQLADQALAVIAHHQLAVMGNAQGGELLSDPAGVAVGDVAQQQLGADTENLSRHRRRVVRG